MKKPVYKRSEDFFEVKHSIKIWGKPHCPYCDRAKALCNKDDLDYTYYQLNEDYTKEFLLQLFPTAKTFPQITVDNKYIGGYMDLRTFLIGPPDSNNSR